MSTEISVTVHKWAHGWELILDEDNATQVRSLVHAEQQVRDYLDTVDPEVDHSATQVTLVLDQDDVTEQIKQAREARQRAEAAEVEAAEKIRGVVADLRHSRSFSLADTAALLGVSRARVSQLDKASEKVGHGKAIKTALKVDRGSRGEHVKLSHRKQAPLKNRV